MPAREPLGHPQKAKITSLATRKDGTLLPTRTLLHAILCAARTRLVCPPLAHLPQHSPARLCMEKTTANDDNLVQRQAALDDTPRIGSYQGEPDLLTLRNVDTHDGEQRCFHTDPCSHGNVYHRRKSWPVSAGSQRSSTCLLSSNWLCYTQNAGLASVWNVIAHVS